MTLDFKSKLLRLDSCVLSDALDRLKLPGAVAGIGRLSTDAKLAGPVRTVRLERADGRLANRHLCSGAIDSASPGDVIAIEHKTRADCAGWGGLLSHAAKARGIAGVVIDGMCRDIDESRELGFTIFGRGVVPMTARSRVIEASFNAPITIGDVTVSPGDWVLADGSGMVFLTADTRETVVEEAEKLVQREAGLLAEIAKGTPISQVMAKTYEHMLRKDPEK